MSGILRFWSSELFRLFRIVYNLGSCFTIAFSCTRGEFFSRHSPSLHGHGDERRPTEMTSNTYFPGVAGVLPDEWTCRSCLQRNDQIVLVASSISAFFDSLQFPTRALLSSKRSAYGQPNRSGALREGCLLLIPLNADISPFSWTLSRITPLWPAMDTSTTSPLRQGLSEQLKKYIIPTF